MEHGHVVRRAGVDPLIHSCPEIAGCHQLRTCFRSSDLLVTMTLTTISVTGYSEMRRATPVSLSCSWYMAPFGCSGEQAQPLVDSERLRRRRKPLSRVESWGQDASEKVDDKVRKEDRRWVARDCLNSLVKTCTVSPELREIAERITIATDTVAIMQDRICHKYWTSV